ncbi:transcriptional regulator AraC family [Vibrio variabilis]|uniref:Transcriptional regulator AraC family n=1 Tax=Vibrio variabilis TaxID=990271 RepID=A0ABQ0JNV0_9VIBR|nr:transcriptional regulator AraC family [Vibrio variabilis]
MWVENNLGYFRAEQLVDLRDLLPFFCEYWFTAIQNLCEEVMQQPFSSKLIRFPYPEPEHSELYKEIFHCPVEFNAEYLEWQLTPRHSTTHSQPPTP